MSADLTAPGLTPEARVPSIRCNFCGKAKDAVAKMCEGPAKIRICNECVLLTYDLIAEEGVFQSRSELSARLTALEADRERLDWLETHPLAVPLIHDARWWRTKEKVMLTEHYGKTLREAIDNARSAVPLGEHPREVTPI